MKSARKGKTGEWLLGLKPAEARAIGATRATQVRAFRMIHHLGQQLHFLADRMYREDGMTAQQAKLLGVVDILGKPSFTQVADVLATTHQNVKQIVVVLVKKGFLEMVPDVHDARIRRLVTTRKNERYWASRDKTDFEVVARWFAGLSPRKTKQLMTLLVDLEGSVSASVARARSER
jgi:DNA-binding MarR family transcriptional regulator